MAHRTTAALLVLLERVVPYDRGQRFLREGFWTDWIFYSLVQNYVLAAGDQRPHPRDRHRHRPLGWRVVFFVVTQVSGLYTYAFHRWQHLSPFGWHLSAPRRPEAVRCIGWLGSTANAQGVGAPHCYASL